MTVTSGALSDVQRSAVSAMQEQGADLVRMIDEVLDLAGAESPMFPVQAVPVDLGGIRRAGCGPDGTDASRA